MGRSIKVLIVDDNPADIELTRDTLEESRLRLDIETAFNGEEALAILREKKEAGVSMPDLMLLDLNMPRMNGQELLHEMRADTALRVIPVVVLTSSDAETDIVKSYDLGANCYVTKPVDLSAFQHIVRSVEGFWLTVVKLP